ncbi:MAG: ribose-phosphate diphosphokinase [Archaeoglobus sp.]|uniref:ribose-phosphate diphosphokinase n=1 Tax=Archaeoglobus sp. TaxID=1872626 RepID=UPI001D347A81|nr:ribose-phosphate diphosphokinase [Archaeoglobus sp.]MBO8180395.1 ribose-phosphate diphosphokinase [Archaeoglobus sp.]
MKIIPCPSSPLLARRIAEVSGLDVGSAVFRRFPDGELYVRVQEKEGVVVGSINSNDDLISLIFALDVLDKAKAVVPYMGYARQDKVFQEGEAVSIKILAEILESKAEEVITVNIHSREAASHFKNLKNLDAMPLIGKHFAEKDVVMISPDKGSLERVKTAAKRAACEWDYMEKRRIDATTVEITPKSIDVEGKDVVIVDDIISTGGTVAEAAKILYSLGAKSVSAACVHAVLADNAAIKLFNAGIKDIIATDTVECAFSRMSVAELIAGSI